MPDLTYLDLGAVLVEDPDTLKHCPTSISKLKLKEVQVEDTWLNKYFSMVPQLTALYLDGSLINVLEGNNDDENAPGGPHLSLPASLK